MMNMLRVPEDVPIEAKVVTKSIQSAQSQMEGQNFEIRKDVLKYDDVLNKQRTVIYDERRRILEGLDLSEQIRPMIESVVRSYVEGATSDGYAEEWNLEQLWTALKTLYPVSLTIEEVIEQAGGDKTDLTRELLLEELIADARSAYDVREEDLGSEVLRELERRVLLTVVDSKWREHLYEMDYLREGIGLRAMAQRDPLVEYQREGFDMFNAMMDGIQEQSVGLLFHLEVQIEGADGTPEPPVPVRTNGTRPAVAASENGAAVTGADGLPALDEEKLAAAQQAHERPRRGAANPQISAKGLERTASARPLVYSAPSLDQAGPEVHTGDQPAADDGAPKRAAGSRANPNRGSRGNRSSGGRRRRG
jgi:preprotein translocase subunit SecA